VAAPGRGHLDEGGRLREGRARGEELAWPKCRQHRHRLLIEPHLDLGTAQVEIGNDAAGQIVADLRQAALRHGLESLRG